MNLIRYIENRYQEVSAELQTMDQSGNYAWKDAHVKALYKVLSHFRWFMQWALYPKVFFDFFMVCLGLYRKPEPVLVNRAKEARDKHLAQQAKKVGFDTEKKKPPEVSEH